MGGRLRRAHCAAAAPYGLLRRLGPPGAPASGCACTWVCACDGSRMRRQGWLGAAGLRARMRRQGWLGAAGLRSPRRGQRRRQLRAGSTPCHTLPPPATRTLTHTLRPLALSPLLGVHHGRQAVCGCAGGFCAPAPVWAGVPRQPPGQLVLPAQDGRLGHRGESPRQQRCLLLLLLLLLSFLVIFIL